MGLSLGAASYAPTAPRVVARAMAMMTAKSRVVTEGQKMKRRNLSKFMSERAFERLARELERTPADLAYLASLVARRDADYAADSEADQDIFPEGG